jgi:DNA (cytosine-5)-methyltransferase 1
MKVLNLYAGLGGNRKFWTGVEVTAVELNPEIARFYKDHFPQDTVIVTDAHQYLIDHFKEFDFIWSSVECPTHSRARFWASKGGRIKPVYPDMRLYQEIIFLKHYFDGLWTVENVVPYYEPIIPGKKMGRHMFWSNFYISNAKFEEADINRGKRDEWSSLHGVNIKGYSFGVRTDKILRNCVHPDLGLHIFNCAFNRDKVTQQTLF